MADLGGVALCETGGGFSTQLPFLALIGVGRFSLKPGWCRVDSTPAWVGWWHPRRRLRASLRWRVINQVGGDHRAPLHWPLPPLGWP